MRRVPHKVEIWIGKAPTRSPWWLGLLILSAIGVVGIGGWAAVQSIVNPGSVAWLNRVFPQLDRGGASDRPLTLAEIKANANQAGQSIGQLLPIANLDPTHPKTDDLLLPIFTPFKCATQCQHISELRVYRPQAQNRTKYELIDQLAIVGVEELLVVAPLSHAKLVSPGSTQQLPLTELSPISGETPTEGAWLHLWGQWQRNNNRLRYGQVVHYDLQKSRLQLLLDWTSLTAANPVWKQVTGSKTNELVVNQTIGLEPQFQVYQLKRLKTSQLLLEPIRLTQPAIDDRTYKNALLLARNGLWSPALQLLKANRNYGSATAQAQRDLIQLHAQFTQANAQRDWASPTQMIAAKLIDGRWAESLKLLKNAKQEGYDISHVLTMNADRLWQRVDTTLKVRLQQADALRWGVLLKTAQQDRSAALAWLKQYGDRARPSDIGSVLALLDTPSEKNSTVASASTPLEAQVESNSDLQVEPVSNLVSVPRLIGVAEPVNLTEEEWINPTGQPLVATGEWYRIRLWQFHDGQQWQHPDRLPPALNQETARSLWQQLSLNQNPQIELINPTSEAIASLTIQALQLTPEGLDLLASGSRVDTPALAMTSSMGWLTPQQTLTFADLNAPSGEFLPIAAALHARSPTLDWLKTPGSAQKLELTGDAVPEWLLMWQSSSTVATTIITSTGELLYDQRQIPEQTLVGILDRQDDLPVLVFQQPAGYRFIVWSAENRRFE